MFICINTDLASILGHGNFITFNHRLLSALMNLGHNINTLARLSFLQISVVETASQSLLHFNLIHIKTN